MPRGRKRKGTLLNATSGLKRCSGCLIEKPANRFYNHRWSPDGLSSNCDDCNARGARAYADRLISRLTVSTPAAKKCPSCARLLPATAYGQSKRDRDGLRGYCRVCDKAYSFVAKWRSSGRPCLSPYEASVKLWDYIDKKAIAYESVDALSGIHFKHYVPVSAGGDSSVANIFVGDALANIKEGCRPIPEVVAEYVRLIVEKPGGRELALRYLSQEGAVA